MMKKQVLALLLAASPLSADDTKISALPSGSPAQAADMIPIARAGANFRLAGSDFLSAGLNLFSDAANSLALRNGTNAQSFYVYNTFTDASNYERLAIKGSTTPGFYWEKAGSGSDRAITFSTSGTSYLMGTLAFYNSATDTVDLGYSTPFFFKNAYIARSVQGSKSKTLVDNTATAFVRLSVADDDYEGCGVIYTAYAEDTATDARQTRTGKTYAAILNNSGTEAVVFSTGDSAVAVTAGTFTCTFDGTSSVADTIDLRATCDTSLAATTTLTFEYRLDCPSTVTVTPQ